MILVGTRQGKQNQKTRKVRLEEKNSLSGQRKHIKNPNVVTSTLLVNEHYASILFSSGADRSFISLKFRRKIRLESQKLKEDFVIDFANGHGVAIPKSTQNMLFQKDHPNSNTGR